MFLNFNCWIDFKAARYRTTGHIIIIYTLCNNGVLSQYLLFLFHTKITERNLNIHDPPKLRYMQLRSTYACLN